MRANQRNNPNNSDKHTQRREMLDIECGEPPLRELEDLASDGVISAITPELRMLDKQGELTTEIVLSQARLECLPESDLSTIDMILKQKDLDLKNRFEAINDFLEDVMDRSEMKEVKRARVARALGCPELTLEQAENILELFNSARHSDPSKEYLFAEIESLSARTPITKRLTERILEWNKKAREELSDAFVFPSSLKVAIGDCRGGMILEPAATLFSKDPKIIIQSFPVISLESDYGTTYEFRELEENAAIFFHELGHILSIERLMRDIPESRELAAKQRELDELLKLGGKGQRLLQELAFLEIDPSNHIVKPPDPSGLTRKELESFRDSVDEKIQDFKEQHERFREVIEPYLELFSDMVAVALTRDPDCIASSTGEKLRRYSKKHPTSTWERSEAHVRLIPTGCVIQEELISGEGPTIEEKLSYLMDCLSSEISLSLIEEGPLPHPTEGNERLTARLLETGSPFLKE